MDRRDGGHGRTETDDMAQVLECLVKAASKLDEILDLLQDPGRVEAMAARYEQFVSGRLPVTVLDMVGVLGGLDGPTERSRSIAPVALPVVPAVLGADTESCQGPHAAALRAVRLMRCRSRLRSFQLCS